ncbi:MAG: hypothetical protein GXP63_06865 [DPANN group archaeon]|nr:hypothetical protein [DPANN group archaeon]
MASSKNRAFSGILVVSLLSLFLSGCSGFGLGGGNDDTVSIGTDFHTGTQGITLRFLPRAPPNTIYASTLGQENDINVLLEVWNRGAYSGPNGDGVPVALYLGGFDQNIIHLPTTLRETPLLKGKSIFNAEGEQDLVQFPDDTYAAGQNGAIVLPEESDIYSPDLQITACYYYETQATLMTCIAYDPYSITTKQVCTPGSILRGQGSQGAPLTVTVDAENVPAR